jgi:hypothetical protein
MGPRFASHHIPRRWIAASGSLDYGNGDFRVALTDHADFSGTLEFVRASKARNVITHPGSGDAYVLVHAIRSQLGIESIAGCEQPVRGWG